MGLLHCEQIFKIHVRTKCEPLISTQHANTNDNFFNCSMTGKEKLKPNKCQN